MSVFVMVLPIEEIPENLAGAEGVCSPYGSRVTAADVDPLSRSLLLRCESKEPLYWRYGTGALDWRTIPEVRPGEEPARLPWDSPPWPLTSLPDEAIVDGVESVRELKAK